VQKSPETNPAEDWGVAISCDAKLGEYFREKPGAYIDIDPSAIDTIIEKLSDNESPPDTNIVPRHFEVATLETINGSASLYGPPNKFDLRTASHRKLGGVAFRENYKGKKIVHSKEGAATRHVARVAMTYPDFNFMHLASAHELQHVIDYDNEEIMSAQATEARKILAAYKKINLLRGSMALNAITGLGFSHNNVKVVLAAATGCILSFFLKEREQSKCTELHDVYELKSPLESRAYAVSNNKDLLDSLPRIISIVD